ncbi:MAG: hypothetical protein QOG00_1405, partial [Pyrinomonadaceae bacterium]|nr:hypothetical protein [Pyrinomonadaceae bacterium]
LSGAILFRLDLFPKRKAPANLSNINLSKALLMQANLNNANLTGANLAEANLGEANLDSALLNQAVLSGAYLMGANFTNADLRGADLTGVILGSTVFGNADLTDAKGLELCRHFVASVIDHATLRKSGRLPLNFLRGCGLPDTLIEYIPSLLDDPLQFYSCFISYSSKDRDFGNRLYADLQNKGVRCWFAPEDLKIGDKIRDRIDESIRLRDKLLLILTESSIASDWVEHEVESALEEEKLTGRTILFPLRLDDAVMESSKAWSALIRRTRQIADFTGWKDHDSYQKSLDRLLCDLKTEEDKKSRSDAASSALFERAVLSPRDTFREEWGQVTSSIVKIAKRNGLINEEDIEASQVINKLFETRIISEAIKEKFYSLKKWHFNVVFFGSSSSVEPQSAITFVNMAKDLQSTVELACTNNSDSGED